MKRQVIMPAKPSHRLIRELAGNPLIVAASTEANIRESYRLIRAALVKLAVGHLRLREYIAKKLGMDGSY